MPNIMIQKEQTLPFTIGASTVNLRIITIQHI